MILTPWIAILAATILIIGTNAGIIGSSRLAYSMAGHKQLPPILSRVHPHAFHAVRVAIASSAPIAALLVAPGSISGAGRPLCLRRHDLVHGRPRVCVVVLRFKQPDTERPWRAPLNIPIGQDLGAAHGRVGGLGTATRLGGRRR